MSNCALCKTEVKDSQGMINTKEYGLVHWKCWEKAD
jgi:hypothetical protein